jgi:RNA polymerase sigma factor (sigma-70 family)
MLPADKLAQLSDVQLIALWQDHHSLPARNAFIERYLPEFNHLVAILSGSGTHTLTIADLQQCLFFWLLESIQHFRGGRAIDQAVCEFRSYAGCVVSRRLKNTQRGESRHDRHVERSARARRILEGTTADGVDCSGRRSPAGLGIADPAESTSELEQQMQLDRALARFDAEDRLIIEGWTQNLSAKEIGEHLGMCAKTVRSRFQELIDRLAQHLNEPLTQRVPWKKPKQAQRKGESRNVNGSEWLTEPSLNRGRSPS